jgi:hypothetical protein
LLRHERLNKVRPQASQKQRQSAGWRGEALILVLFVLVILLTPRPRLVWWRWRRAPTTNKISPLHGGRTPAAVATHRAAKEASKVGRGGLGDGGVQAKADHAFSHIGGLRVL